MTTDISTLFTAMAQNTPKTDLVVFMGRVGGRFMDNAKYLYRHCLYTAQPFSSVFLTHHFAEYRVLRKADLPCLLFPSNEAVAQLSRAKVLVCDDFWWRMEMPVRSLLAKARTLQIWHGIPLKLIGLPEADSQVNMNPEKEQMLRMGYSDYDVVISTSPFVTRTSLGRAFQCEAMWETGYPRNDVLFRPPDDMDLMGVDAAAYETMSRFRQAGFKTVFYMPTFRDTGGDAFVDGALDLARLEAFGRKQKIAFFLKFHPYVDMNLPLNMKTVHLVRSDSDAYPLLAHTDCLLTDYSSVAYDFLLTGRPIIFFPYDLEKYLASDREMFYAFETMAPGPHVRNEPELFAALYTILKANVDNWKEERSTLCGQLFSMPDGNASERIIHRMRNAFFA